VSRRRSRGADASAARSHARPTLTDVASLAGVSRQTASRVARGGALVSPETAARVEQAIAQLGYRPDPVARALSTGRGRTLGVLSHTTRNAIVDGIERAAQEAGYGMSLALLSTFDPEVVQSTVERLVQTGCDGVILMAPWVSDAEALRRLKSPVPMLVTSQAPGFSGPMVYPEAVGSARDIVEHLLELGHRTVWHVAGPAGWIASRLRAEGWEQALRAAGAPVPAPLAGDWTSRSGYEAGLRLAEIPDVTAVFAANDETALGLLYALAERGRRVPDEISVAGYDDIPGAEFFQPALTTVRVDNLARGRYAVEQLLRQLRGEPPESPIVVGYELVIRDSTASAR
jgi:DNA-binding LacI/PurR family transcriptional regulator